MRNGFLWSSVVLFSLTSLFLVNAPSADQKTSKKKFRTEPRFVPGEMIVKLKKATGLQSSAVHSLLSVMGASHPVNVQRFDANSEFAKIQVKDSTPVLQLVKEAQNTGAVEYAEPNWIYYASENQTGTEPEKPKNVFPNDPRFNLTWGLYNVGQRDRSGQEGLAGVDIGATVAWTKGTGSQDVVVAVIDTGIDYNHEDLKNNIFINTKEIADNKIDDDGNGYVDDVRGWNFYADNNNPMDDLGHGSHCSGTIAGEGNNGIGVAGVAWKARLVPIKFLGGPDGSGTTEGAVKSVKYATKIGARIMSNSWGGGGYSQALFDAIKEARDKGILFVAAAGNESENNDNTPSYPASYKVDNIISVAATDNRDKLADFSNYGKKTVHLAAPGVSIYSTVPGNKYDTYSGTSMATPHVSGAAALLWSLHMNWTFADIKTRLLATADPVRGLSNKTVTGGRLNVNNAIDNFIPPVTAPNPALWKVATKAIESEHPYKVSKREIFELAHVGAKYLRAHFQQSTVEKSFDFIRIYDERGRLVEELTGTWNDYTSEYVDGSKLKIVLDSDHSDPDFGFVVDRYNYIE